MSDALILQSFRVHLRRRPKPLRPLGPRTQTLYLWWTERYLDWNTVPLEQLTAADIGDWIDAQDTPSKARHAWLAMRAFTRFLLYEEILTRDPMRDFRMPQEPKKIQPILADDTLDAMVATCRTRSFLDVRDRALLLTLASTSMRRAELARMAMQELDVVGGTVIVNSVKVAPGQPDQRVAFLDDITVTALSRYLRVRPEHPMVWLSRDRHALTEWGVTQVVRRRAKMVGAHVTPHMFRRRFAAAWLMNGGSQVGLMNVAGWSDPTMPNTYAAAAAAEIAKMEHQRMFSDQVRREPRKRRKD